MGSKRKQPETKKMLVQLDDVIASEDLATKLKVSERSLRNWTKTGIGGVTLEKIKIGSRVYYHKQNVELFIDRLQRNRAKATV